MTEQVAAVLAKVFQANPAGIRDDTPVRSLPGWDSVRHLGMVLALEQAFAVEFEPEQMEQMHHVRDIVRFIRVQRGGA